jgi:hypothetical protein
MWGVDDEIRAESSTQLARGIEEHDDAWQGARGQAVLDRAEEMVYKEANILLPLCSAQNLTERRVEADVRGPEAATTCASSTRRAPSAFGRRARSLHRRRR